MHPFENRHPVKDRQFEKRVRFISRQLALGSRYLRHPDDVRDASRDVVRACRLEAVAAKESYYAESYVAPERKAGDPP
jgi:hypothetical protein